MLLVATLLAIIVVGGIFLFNQMVGMRRLVQNSWSDVDVFLRRRSDLVPNLVAAVKAAAIFESSTLEAIAAARSRASNAKTLSARSEGEEALSQQISNTLVIAESYPDLKVSQNFLQLQSDLAETERHIADARRYYNACVRDYNTLIESFPHRLIANAGGFRAAEFFEVESVQERATPSVEGLHS